ncbi:MAG TPA: HD domain-containing protein [archaeon]|nr:HD domain-containing protein [archaeon]
MVKLKDALELAEKIKDKSLREKTIKLLKEPEISNPEIIYPAAKFEEIPAWPIGAHHHHAGGELEHTVSITKIVMALADHFENMYKMKINKDHLIAGALLHDIAKVFLYKKIGNEWQFTGANLDHADFGACELYARGFPEEVVHIVASHGGEQGAAGANPRTVEALLVYWADFLDASVESSTGGEAIKQLLQLALKGSE